MPTVRKYGTPQVAAKGFEGRLSPEGGGTAQSEGAGVDESRAQTFATIAQVGKGVAQVGADLVRQQRRDVDEARQRAINLNVIEGQNVVSEWKKTRLHDPKTGALTVAGKAAMPLPEQIDAEFEQLAGETMKGMKTPEARLAFTRVVAQERYAIGVTVRDHVDREIKTFTANVLKAKIDNGIEAAVRSGTTPDANGRIDFHAAAVELQSTIDALRIQAPSLGIDPEQLQVQERAIRTETHAGIITQLVASGKAQTARAYFADVRDELSEDGKAKFQQIVTRGVADQEGERLSGAIWSALGPKSDSEPISLDTMETRAREQLGPDDVDTLKATIAALRSRKQAVDDSRRERRSNRDVTIWGAVLKGASYDAIARIPEAAAAPEELLKVRDYLQRQTEHKENLAAARESRANAADVRTFNAEQREQRKLEMNGWSRYWEMSNPPALRALTPGEIMQKLPTLGSAHVERLLNDKARLSKDEKTFGTAVIDRDLFREVASESGFDYAYKSPSTLTATQRANLGKAEAAVRDELARQQLKASKTFTREEQRAVIAQVLDAKVMVKDAGWFYSDVEQPAVIVNPKDREKAYVPIDQIPETAQTEGLNYLKGIPNLSPFEQRQRMERAYALKLLGASKAEIEAVLQGGTP